jgi:hypothetical protein
VKPFEAKNSCSLAVNMKGALQSMQLSFSSVYIGTPSVEVVKTDDVTVNSRSASAPDRET